MDLPGNIPMVCTLHLKGIDGLATHQFRSDKYGITKIACRPNKNEGWNYTYTADALPDRSFPCICKLRAALRTI